MPERAKEGSLRIDRLILDVPGLEPREAGALADSIGRHLAALEMSGTFASLTIELDGQGEDLAARIAAAIRERIL